MKSLNIALLVLFDPPNGFRMIKRNRDSFNYLAPVILLVLLLVSRISSIYMTHYPLAPVSPEEANLWQEASATILPLLTWVVGCYLVTTILDGESMLREVFAAAAYSMLPYIIFTIVIAPLTNLMSLSDASLYVWLGRLVACWVVLLFLISLSVMNSYSLFETLKVAVISLIACVFMWAVLGLIYILGLKLYDFIVEVISEYRMLFFG